MMEYTVDSFVGRMIKAIAIISVIMMIGGVLLFYFTNSGNAIGFVLGVTMSMALNIVKVIWLRHSVKRAISMEKNTGGSYIGIQYILRFVATGLVLTAAHFLPVADMFGAAVGLLSMPLANYAINFIGKPHATNETADKNEDNPNNINEEQSHEF